MNAIEIFQRYIGSSADQLVLEDMYTDKDEKQALEEHKKLKKCKESLVNVELLAVAVGTLIWGFGDLIPF